MHCAEAIRCPDLKRLSLQVEDEDAPAGSLPILQRPILLFRVVYLLLLLVILMFSAMLECRDYIWQGPDGGYS